MSNKSFLFWDLPSVLLFFVVVVYLMLFALCGYGGLCKGKGGRGVLFICLSVGFDAVKSAIQQLFCLLP